MEPEQRQDTELSHCTAIRDTALKYIEATKGRLYTTYRSHDTAISISLSGIPIIISLIMIVYVIIGNRNTNIFDFYTITILFILLFIESLVLIRSVINNERELKKIVYLDSFLIKVMCKYSAPINRCKKIAESTGNHLLAEEFTYLEIYIEELCRYM